MVSFGRGLTLIDKDLYKTNVRGGFKSKRDYVNNTKIVHFREDG
jgi:hypothetical protein